MQIKKFTASSMKEALLKVKAELGDDAMILKTRKLPPSLIPLGGKNNIEVTAAIDNEATVVAPDSMPELSMKEHALNKDYLQKLKAMPPKPEPITVPPVSSTYRAARANAEALPTGPEQDSIQIMKLHDELGEMKKLLASILATGETKASGGFAGPWAILYKRLSDSEIRQELAHDLLEKLRKSSPNPGRGINQEFINILAESFPVAPANPERLQVFIGPTGAGKTTTIAKLAAYFSLEKNKKVSLITADTYRIAAVEQLRAYAEIVGIDLQVVFSADEVHEAIESCDESDIILVDTAGRSQKNREHLDELDSFIGALMPESIHLVLSAGTKESDMRDIIRRYRRFGINRVVFTKLDETLRLGNIYNVISDYMIPVSYFTFGQSVPDDIETAQPALFVKKLLEGSSL